MADPISQRPLTKETWHLNKRVPVALILAIFVQTMAGVWWLATLSSRVSNAEVWINRNDKLETRLTKMETILERIERTITRDRTP